MFGPDYNYFLPSETIGALEGKSTVYEVRLRILKTPPKKLKATVLKELKSQGLFGDEPPLVSLQELEAQGVVSLEYIDDLPGDYRYTSPLDYLQKHRIWRPVAYEALETPWRNGMAGCDAFMGAAEWEEMNIQLPLSENACGIAPASQGNKISSTSRFNIKYIRSKTLSGSVDGRGSSLFDLSDWKAGSIKTPSITEDACSIIERGLVTYTGATRKGMADAPCQMHAGLLGEERLSSMLRDTQLPLDRFLSARTFRDAEFQTPDILTTQPSVSARFRDDCSNGTPCIHDMDRLWMDHVLLRVEPKTRMDARDSYDCTLVTLVSSELSGMRTVDHNKLSEHALASEDRGCSGSSRGKIRSWSVWLSQIRTEAFPYSSPLESIERTINGMTNKDLLPSDEDSNSVLHSLISSIDPLTMQADDVRKVLKTLFDKAGVSILSRRNKQAFTPLHLAVRSALPHVVAEIMLEASKWYFVEDKTMDRSTRIKAIAKRLTAVQGYDGTTLLEDLSSTYWLARASNEDGSVLMEVDALLCICLITDAMAGRLPPDDHQFRPLRAWYKKDRKRKPSHEVIHNFEKLVNWEGM
jgi:hypothetical protein